MTDPFAHGPRAARPAQLPPVWPPIDPETGLVDLSDDSDPPDGFFTDPDVFRRRDAATTVAQGLSPAEAMRESNRKLSELTRAQWDFDVRRRTYEEAKAFSFTDRGDGREPVFAELSPEDAERVDGFTADTTLQVDFPREYGGYFASIRDPVEDREIGVVPRGLVLAVANNSSSRGKFITPPQIADPDTQSDDGDGWFSRFLSSDQLREMVLDLLPIVGNFRSGRDALESYAEAYEALERGDWEAFLAHGGMGALNTIGAIGGPFSAPLVRIVRAGIRRLADDVPGLGQVLARRDIGKAANAAEHSIPPVEVEKAFKRAFSRMTDDQIRKVKAIFPNFLGSTAERHAIRQLRTLRQGVDDQGSATTVTVDMGGKLVKRRFDARVAELRRNFYVRGMKAFDPDARSVGVEVKAHSSSFGKQARADEAIVKEGSSVQQVLRLRYSLKDIPEKDLVRAAEGMLKKHVNDKPGGLREKDVNRLVAGIKRLRRSEGDRVTAEMTVGILAREAANVVAWDEEERRRKEAERRRKEGERWRRDAGYHGEAVDQLMTGA